MLALGTNPQQKRERESRNNVYSAYNNMKPVHCLLTVY